MDEELRRTLVAIDDALAELWEKIKEKLKKLNPKEINWMKGGE